MIRELPNYGCDKHPFTAIRITVVEGSTDWLCECGVCGDFHTVRMKDLPAVRTKLGIPLDAPNGIVLGNSGK